MFLESHLNHRNQNNCLGGWEGKTEDFTKDGRSVALGPHKPFLPLIISRHCSKSESLKKAFILNALTWPQVRGRKELLPKPQGAASPRHFLCPRHVGMEVTFQRMPLCHRDRPQASFVLNVSGVENSGVEPGGKSFQKRVIDSSTNAQTGGLAWQEGGVATRDVTLK